jgi:hypothetical protein
MGKLPAETAPFNLDEWPEEGHCVRYADGSSVCVANGAIVLVEANPPYGVGDKSTDSEG